MTTLGRTVTRTALIAVAATTLLATPSHAQAPPMPGEQVEVVYGPAMPLPGEQGRGDGGTVVALLGVAGLATASALALRRRPRRADPDQVPGHRPSPGHGDPGA